MQQCSLSLEELTAALEIVLPMPPSLNNAYTNGRGHNRRVLTDEGRAFKYQAVLIARNTAARALWAYPPRARLSIEMRFVFTDRRSNSTSDIDNRYKLAGDAVAQALGYNDNVIDRITLERALDVGVARCEVRVRVL